jgi:hypothetical protein
MNDSELLEALADAEHDSWARWMSHLFTKGWRREDGSITLPGGYVKALQRQIDTSYADLTEQEKEYDREEVRRILPLIERRWISELGALSEENGKLRDEVRGLTDQLAQAPMQTERSIVSVAVNRKDGSVDVVQ